jgi:hypothetical protein
LVGKRRNARVSNSDSVERLEVVDDAERSTFLFHAKPSGAIRGIGMFVNACYKLVLEHLNDIVEDA